MELLKLAMGVLLLFLSTLLMGVSSQTPNEIFVRAGEMALLVCKVDYPNNTKTHWKSDTNQEFNNMSAAEQRQMGVVFHGNSLVILNASVNHQGNYSCSPENSMTQDNFTLTVYKALPSEYEKGLQYPLSCPAQKYCQLNCPDDNIPAVIFDSSNITWRKDNGEPVRDDGYFSSVEEKDGGIYTCTQSYLYGGQIYNKTFKVELDVQQDNRTQKYASIASPRNGEVFQVELGSRQEIDCEVVANSCHDVPFWVVGEDFPEAKETCSPVEDRFRVKATLVIEEVTEKDLLHNYTCKLESESQESSFVSISFVQKARPSHTSLVVCIICLVTVTVVVVVVYVKLKVDITLFLRDTLCWRSSASDGKSYDAFLMCYESNTEGGLNSQDRKELENALEDTFGYTLCLYDRDVLPGNPVAEAVLDCIEQSRAVVLVPSSPGPGPGSGLLSAIHAALVERQTHLVFINTDSTDALKSGSLPEALQLLSEAGDHVTWKGTKSMNPSSSFWKRLRYYLPAPQRPSKIKLLPQTVQGATTQYNV